MIDARRDPLRYLCGFYLPERLRERMKEPWRKNERKKRSMEGVNIFYFIYVALTFKRMK